MPLSVVTSCGHLVNKYYEVKHFQRNIGRQGYQQSDFNYRTVTTNQHPHLASGQHHVQCHRSVGCVLCLTGTVLSVL